MGASEGGIGGRSRLGLLAAVAALFVLVPATQASAAGTFTLTVNVVGEGVVVCEVDGINEGECEEEEAYEEGTEIKLLAEPEFEWEFVEFVGCTPVALEECELEMYEDHEVTATFAPEPTERTLTIEKTGAGRVECEAEEALEACKPTYPKETEVTLYAFPASGSEFLGWGGDCAGAGEEESCLLEMGTTDHLVTAAFSGEEESGGGGGSGGGGSGGGGASGPGEPEEEGDLAQRPLLRPGKAKIGGAGLYKGGRAMLRISCKGQGPCKGAVKLIAKLRVGHGAKRVAVGRAAFSLPAGASRALTIKLSAPAKKLLGKGRTLVAKVGGAGVTASTVRIRPTER